MGPCLREGSQAWEKKKVRILGHAQERGQPRGPSLGRFGEQKGVFAIGRKSPKVDFTKTMFPNSAKQPQSSLEKGGGTHETVE